jgi:hypothetical protein
MWRLAITSAAERESLRRIERVVRQGRVLRIGTDRIVLEDGSIPTDRHQVHVDCTAAGLRVAPNCPIFEPDRITLQQIRPGSPTFNAALIAYVESARDDDADKNRLCPPNPHPSAAVDWISTNYISFGAAAAWSNEPDIRSWLERSRLNLLRGVAEHMTDPRMQAALTRLAANRKPAMEKLEQLLGETTVTMA